MHEFLPQSRRQTTSWAKFTQRFADKLYRIIIESIFGHIATVKRLSFTRLQNKLEQDDVLIITELNGLGQDHATGC